ncbi:replication protein (plasmid) [Limosilactobacillus reuteri]|uniref:replication protein n=1 Tax=Lactobacillales TaxID=186826 RepID=UPI002A82089E|nr:replication protein [Streptococcus thoraltensis]MCI5549131.1 replication protein [Lactobacillus johnsonii]MDY4760798.1 replication protein [Streptococcus thoraltensis]MDY6043026.1 replication protein [Lactobacillus johnsonii]
MADERKRNWSFIVYPDSAPKKWQSVLADYHVPFIVSPLHSKDRKDDGTFKKAHYHVLILFSGKKSYNQVKQITDKLSSPIPEAVASTKGLVRYFAHLDNPEKAQYDPSEIKGFCGADVDSYFTMSRSTRRSVLKDITQYILNNHVTDLSTLVQEALDRNDDNWFSIIVDTNTWYLNMLINSEWKLAHQDRYK